MKLWRPRFSVRTLAIVVAIVGLGVWWWDTWPQRTADAFIGLLREGKFDEASQLVATTQDCEYLERRHKSHELTREFLRTRRKDSEYLELLEMFRNEPEYLELLRKEPELNPELLELISQDRQTGSKPNGATEPFPAVRLLDRSWSDILLGRGEVHLGIDSALFVQRGRVSMFCGFDEFD